MPISLGSPPAVPCSQEFFSAGGGAPRRANVASPRSGERGLRQAPLPLFDPQAARLIAGAVPQLTVTFPTRTYRYVGSERSDSISSLRQGLHHLYDVISEKYFIPSREDHSVCETLKNRSPTA